MNTLVFGGSFDPPHVGNAALLKAAKARIRPDCVLVVPAFHAPLKDTPAAAAADRLAMLKLALPGARIDTTELRSRRPVYTFETLERLRRQDPKGELHFVVGSDSAARLPEWKELQRLRALAQWRTAKRPGSGSKPPSFFKTLPGKMPDISSTELRRCLALGEDLSAKLSPEVLGYIERRGLYGRALLKLLKPALSSRRYAHSLAVARLAGELARRWGFNEGKARLAGLLHDCGRCMPAPEMPAYARARRLKIPALEETARRNPLLLHAYLSEDLCRRRYAVTDPAVLSAVRKHTLGDLRMSPLDRLLYVADACSYDRAYAAAPRLRKAAFLDMKAAFKDCVALKLDHAISRQAWLHPLTVSLWNSLQDP